MDTTKNTTVRWISAGVASLIVGIAIGIAPRVFASPSGNGAGDIVIPLASAPGQHQPNYQKNANGQTYGSELDAPDPADAPDLIAAYATNGEQGYVYATDLHPDFYNPPSSPEQAIQQSEAQKTRVIDVYTEDGTTKIGEFVVHSPNG